MTTRKAMNAVALAVRICPDAKLLPVLAALIDHADRRHRVRLTQVQIGALIGTTEGTAMLRLHRLEELGLIRLTHRHDRRGQAPNLTTLTLSTRK